MRAKVGARLIAVAIAMFCAMGLVMAPDVWAVNVTTYHYDTLRTGWNPNETALTPANVHSGSFGFLAAVKIPANQLVGHPLIVEGVSVTGVGLVNVVYLVDNNNNVFALNATTGKLLLHVNLGTRVPGSANPHNTAVGIRSTPVIDAATQTLYVLADAYVQSTPTYMLHALALGTLKDIKPPHAVAATNFLTDGTTVHFKAEVQQQKPALLEANGNIYAAFGSFADMATNESRGWVLGWNASSLTPLASNALTNRLATANKCHAAPIPCFLTSVWMSGFGISADQSGNLYFVTANGGKKNYGAPNNYAESVLRVSGDLSTVESYFTPYNVDALDAIDEDFGSGGVTLLPNQPGSNPALAVAAGKAGTMYLMNQASLGGHVTTAPDKVLAQANIGGCWCGQSYFTGPDGMGRIVSGGGANAQIWQVQTSPTVRLVQQSISATLTSGQDPGFFTSVSSNGKTANTAIIWVIGRPTTAGGPLTLYALNGANAATLFSASFGRWANPNNNAEITPVVANGNVYIAVANTLYILGPGGRPAPLLEPDADPLVRTAGHEIYGRVEEVTGNRISVRLRTGNLVTVDNEPAVKADRSVEVHVGESLGIHGEYDQAGVYHAQMTFRAKSSPALWLSDK
jgi:PQQ enzyme repeat